MTVLIIILVIILIISIVILIWGGLTNWKFIPKELGADCASRGPCPSDMISTGNINPTCCKPKQAPQKKEYFDELETIRKNPEKFLFNNGHEKDEQILVLKYLPADAHVLELGGRSGAVSKAINLILSDKTKHLVVEPSTDTNIINNLETMGKKLGFKVFNGAIGKKKILYDGYSTNHGYGLPYEKSGEVEVNTKTIDQVQNEYNIRFNAIAADCEGCLVQILEDFPNLLDQINWINIEYDMPPEICAKFITKMKNNGFRSIARRKGWMDDPNAPHKNLNTYDGIGFEVWKK